MSATYALARWGGLTVTALSSGILYVLVFGVGTDYALLLVSRYREQLRRHEDHRHAMAQALRSAAPPIIASAGTVVLSLLRMLFASVNSDRGLGPVLAAGVLAALLINGRRGRLVDPIWTNRRVLLIGADHLSDKQWDRLEATFDADDPTGQVQTAWIIKERSRMLLDSGTDETLAARRLWQFQTIAADSGLPEAATLAGTIDTWWPAIRVALAEGVNNGRTEGFNRIIKQTKRVACGFRNMANYRRRIMVHVAVTRPRPTAA